jgi:hypothetical protein
MKSIQKWLFLFFGFLLAAPASAYTASKVTFEARPEGIYRVHVTYTVPSLKEVREAFVEFTRRSEAESYYFDLLRGADFYLSDPKRREFKVGPRQPTPW